VPRLGVHLQLGHGLRRAAERAAAIRAEAIQVFVDNPTAWGRRAAPPRDLADFRERLAELGVRPVAVHASYLVNLAGPEAGFRRRSIEVLAAEMLAARAYGARLVNVHTGSHRDTSVEAGIERVATGVAEVLARVDEAPSAVDGSAPGAGGPGAGGPGAGGPGAGGPGPTLVLENAAGGGWAIGSSVAELAAVAERAAIHGVPDDRLGFCLDTAHAWGAGVRLDEPDAIDGLLDTFEAELGLERLVMVHLNDSSSEPGSRLDRHEHLGAGRIGSRGLGHLVRHPRLADRPFILETPGMAEGYDAVNLERARALLEGRPLEPLGPEAFELKRRTHAAAPADDDVEAGTVTRPGP
jgi:deoxyribonuclease-4